LLVYKVTKYIYILRVKDATAGVDSLDKKILIGAILGVVVIVIAGAALMNSNNSNSPPKNTAPHVDGEYNYSFSRTASFNYTAGGYTYTQNAGAGYEFIIATITLKNIDYTGSLLTTSINNFDFKVGGISYYWDTVTVYHPGYKSTVTLDKGAQYTFTIVYKVPSGTTGGEIVSDFLLLNVVHNSTLV